MAYKFGADEPVQAAIRRCAREQLDKAAFELSDGLNADRPRAIHNARKAIKKERSLLRLARAAMPREQRQRENDALRETARSLSGARDADVMIASVAELSERFAGQLPAAAFDRIRADFEARRSAPGGDTKSTTLEQRADEELAAVRARVDEWRLRRGGWKALESGLLRSYGRGRHAFSAARAGSDMDDLHAWRKRAKDLWYHERLLADTCGQAVRGHAKELDRLSDLLGDDHDLALLRLELAQHSPEVAVDVGAVIRLIDHRRAELQTEAIRIGQRVYAETPKAFRRRMRACWRAGRALARVPQEQHPAELAAATR
jgi:CHAD domain-containing protein